jgi:hypothetical protein
MTDLIPIYIPRSHTVLNLSNTGGKETSDSRFPVTVYKIN